MNTVEKSRESLTEVVDSPKVQTKREEGFFTVILDDDGVKRYCMIPRSKIRRNMNEYAEQLFKKEICCLLIIRENNSPPIKKGGGAKTVEAVGTLQTQGQKEDEFFAVTHDDDGVHQSRRIPRSKLRRNMNEYGEQLFWKEVQTFYIHRE